MTRFATPFYTRIALLFLICASTVAPQALNTICQTVEWYGPCNVECGSGVQDVVVEAVPIPSNCTPTIYYQRPCNGSLCGLDRCVFGSCGTNACALLTKTAPKYGWTKRQVFSPSSTSEFDVAFDAKKNIVVHVWVTNHLNSNSINAFGVTVNTSTDTFTQQFNYSGKKWFWSSPKISVNNGIWVISVYNMTYTGAANSLLSLTSSASSPSMLFTESTTVVGEIYSNLVPGISTVVREGQRSVPFNSGFLVASAAHSDYNGAFDHDILFIFSSDGISWNVVNALPNVTATNNYFHLSVNNSAVYIAYAHDNSYNPATAILFHENITDTNLEFSYVFYSNSSLGEKTPHLVLSGGYGYLSHRLSQMGASSIEFRRIPLASATASPYSDPIPEPSKYNFDRNISFDTHLFACDFPVVIPGNNGLILMVWTGIRVEWQGNLPTILGKTSTLIYSYSLNDGLTWSSEIPRFYDEIHGNETFTHPTGFFDENSKKFKVFWTSTLDTFKTGIADEIYIDPCNGTTCFPTDETGRKYILPEYKLDIPTVLNFPDLVILGKNISGLDFTGNLIVANTSVNLTGLTVDGNLTFTGKSVISVSDGVTTISASNCINLNDVVLNSTGKPSTIRLQSTSTASCWIVGNITTSDGRCARATIVGRNILEITFPCENGTGSQTLLIVAVSVVAVLIVLGTIIAVAYYFVRKYTVDAEFKKIHTPPSQRADE